MGRYISNEETMQLFRDIEDLKDSGELSGEQLDRQVEKLQNRIITELHFLVYSNAQPYRKFPNYEDLVQEGFIGLLKAARRFDYRRFPNFFVFAEQWIRHHVKRAASRFDIVYNPNRSRVVYAEPAELGIEDELSECPEDLFLNKERTGKIEEILGELPERDSDIVKRIFGLGVYTKPQTLREIGPVYNLTHERIRQIKNKVISKLKKNERLSELG